MIKTPNGYIVVSAVESFRVLDSPGWRDHQHVIVTLTSGRQIDTGMYEEDFLRAYHKALETRVAE